MISGKLTFSEFEGVFFDSVEIGPNPTVDFFDAVAQAIGWDRSRLIVRLLQEERDAGRQWPTSDLENAIAILQNHLTTKPEEKRGERYD